MLSILTQFLSNRSQRVTMDGCWSELVNDVLAVRKKCFGPVIIVPPVHIGAFCHSGEQSDRLCQ